MVDSEAAGNAINQVTERVSIVEDNLENATITYDEFVQGRRAPSNAGVIISDSSRCTCKSLITVKAGRTLSVDGITSGYKYVIAYGSYDSGWLTGSYSLTASADITILINVAPVSGNSITPTSFELAAVVSTMLSEMKDAVEELSTAGVAPIAITGEWVLGEIKSSGANGSSDKRIRLNDYTLFVKAGTYIVCDDPAYQFGCAEYSGQTAGTFILLSAWANEYTVQNDSYIRIVMRYADNSLTSSADLETMPPTMHAYPSEGSIAFKFDSMSTRIDAFESIKEQFAGPFSALWEIGSIRETGSNSSSTTRIRTKDYIPATAGNVIKTTNSLYKLSVHEYSSEAATAQTSTSDFDTEYEIKNDGYIRIVMAYTDDRTVTSDDLTALPSALIVYKADSLTAEVEEIKDKIASGSSDIADYYAEEMADTIDKVGMLQTEPALTFMTVTDIHRYVAGVQNFQSTIRNMRYFSEKVGCDFVLNLGDNVEGNTAPDVTYGYCRDMLAAFNSIGLPYVFTLGNHDTNPYYQSGSTRYPFNMGQCYGAHYPLTKASKINVFENGTDYYIDFESLGIRLISLNGNNVDAGRTTYTFGATSADFLTDALNTDKSVIFVTHVTPIRDHAYERQDVGYNTAITSALTAFVEGGGKLLELSGHTHVDIAFISPWTAIMQVCQKFEQADLSLTGYQVITGYIDAISNPARTAQTAAEDAWSVNIYKPISNTLHQIRFGAGSDRHFHLTPVGAGTVASQLEDVTWSSSDTAVATVSGGVITGVGAGRCAILAKDSNGNYECWIVEVS